MIWLVLLIVSLAMTTGMFWYLIRRISCFPWIKKKKKKKLTAAGILILGIGIAWALSGFVNTVVILLHLGVFWGMSDIVFLIIRKLIKREDRQYLRGYLVLIVTALYLTGGWYLAHHVWQTHYTIDTEKNVESLRIVQFADSHLGTTFHAAGFQKQVEEMQKCNPDLVVLTGDFVDDASSREDMIGACEALGKLKTTFGVYYAFGNHDKGYYGNEHRGYSGEELVEELEKNGVIVLQDDVVTIDNRFYLIGRQDRSEEQRGSSRAEIKELMEELDPALFTIVLDHQPNDYEKETQAQADLVLSGHTHGGQIFPFNRAGEWIHANDKTYGYEKRENTNFIVTSGISDWEIKFKTGCKSEYVVIDITGR